MDEQMFDLLKSYMDTQFTEVRGDISELQDQVRTIREDQIRDQAQAQVNPKVNTVKGGVYGSGLVASLVGLYEYLKHKNIF